MKNVVRCHLHRPAVLTFLLLFSTFPLSSWSLVSESTSRQQRNRLAQAFSSPSGKLTFSPEVVVPEPTDPTAILLQSNAVTTLSQRLRTGKANVAFLQCSSNALQLFVTEQATALGNFPGPVPVVYCLPSTTRIITSNDDDEEEEAESNRVSFSEITDAGADGVMIPVCHGKEILGINDLESTTESEWRTLCQEARQCGLEPIPEIIMGSELAATWGETEMNNLVEVLTAAIGAEPVSIVLTIHPPASHADQNDDAQGEPAEDAASSVGTPTISLPKIPRSLGKRVSILGSVRMQAGENRLGLETARYKAAGFTGALLRSECLPGGLRLQLDLDIVSQFWSACIQDLKSVKSKAFNFRSKNNMEMDVATKWMNYRKSVLESGSLGDPMESASMIDTERGDYQGF